MGRMRDLELVTTPGAKLAIPEDGADFPTGHAIVAIASLVAGVGWTLFAAATEEAADPRLEIAANVLALSLKDLEHGMESQARVMADDARTRSTLATPEIDRATIEDVLQDFLQAGNLTGVAIFDASGKAAAIVGRTELAEINLSATKLLAEGGASLWALGGDALVVATAPIPLGSANWTLLCAKRVEIESIEAIRKAVGTPLGIAVDGKLLIAAADGEQLGALEAAALSPSGMTSYGDAWLFADTLGSGPRPPLVVAATDRARTPPRFTAFIWFPMVLLAASAIANVLIALRR